MAIFKSNLLADVRGSVNGTTFSRTRAGAVMRSRTVPVQPNTPAQVEQRSRMQAATDLFRQLTNAQIDDWSQAISGTGFQELNSLGDAYTPSAKQLFTSLELNLRSINLTGPDVSKFLADPNKPDVGAANMTVTWAVANPDELSGLVVPIESAAWDTALFQIAATPPLLPSVRNYKKYLRVISINATGGPVASPGSYDAAGDYNALFSTLNYPDLIGNNIGIAVRAVNQTNGLASSWLMVGFATIAAGTV